MVKVHPCSSAAAAWATPLLKEGFSLGFSTDATHKLLTRNERSFHCYAKSKPGSGRAIAKLSITAAVRRVSSAALALG